MVQVSERMKLFRTRFVGKAKALATNQDHFGRLPSTIDSLRAQAADAANGSFGEYVAAVGRATHYVQDHLTLGHMVPGTRLFAGPVGAPVRFVVHQVFGGEIAFRDAQIRATRSFLNGAGVPL